MSEPAVQAINTDNNKSKIMRRASKRLNLNDAVVFNYQTIDSSGAKLSLSMQLENLLNHRIAALLMAVLIITYTVLVIIRIAFDVETTSVNTQLNILELVFLSLFVIEVILRIIVYKKAYFVQFWNDFDIVIITVCLIVIIGSLANSSITNTSAYKVGQVLRVFRLFLMFRKMNTFKRFKNKLIKRNSVINLTSPSEKVLDTLNTIFEMEWIASNSVLKSDLEWCIFMIKEQKIYQTNVRAVKEELRDLVNWAVNNQYEESETPARAETYIKVVALENYGAEIEGLLAESQKWEFDIFQLEKLSENKSLEILSCHLFSLYNLYHCLSIDSVKFQNFIREVQKGYHKDNPYHNSTHGADVVQSFYYLLSTCQAIDICSLCDSDIATCLLSAGIHDYDHPGFNNIYLINTSHNLALTYNDKSVLENYHVSAAFKLMLDEKNNIFERVRGEEKKKIRGKIIALVLATDFARHFADLGKFQLKFSNSVVKDDDDRQLAMEMMMHASDVGNPSRPWKICYEWAMKVMNEFFAQGDKEREMGLMISNLCDRYSVSIPKSQIGFTELFIEPTFHMLELLLPNTSENLKYITENKEKWKEAMESSKIIS